MLSDVQNLRALYCRGVRNKTLIRATQGFSVDGKVSGERLERSAQACAAVDARGTRLLAFKPGLHETHASAVFRCLRTPRTRRLRRRLHDTASSLPRRQASGEASAVVWVWEADLDDSGAPPLTNAPWARERYGEICGDMRRYG